MCILQKSFLGLFKVEKVNSHFPIRFVKYPLAALLMLSSAIVCFPSDAIMKS